MGRYQETPGSSFNDPRSESARTDRPHISVSHQIAARFGARLFWRRFIALFYIVVTVIYLCWRYTIINPHSLPLSICYYAAECIGFVLGLTIIFSSWHYRHRTPLRAPRGLDVDVFVLTYKEPFDIIRRTVTAASRIDYPHRTWVLDDGNRPEIRDLAAELGIHYLTRGDNRHAKAGNINHGLQHSSGEFVAVFDADHIPQPHALDVMLGFFIDKNMALVQTPQDYYNIDAFQYMNPRHQAGLWHDQSFFYNIAQPCRDQYNGSSCVGTGVVYRRSALESIGGIPIATVTEDIHTSLKLHKSGYRTIFLNEPVAYGIAAADLNEYYKTRHRWAHGNLHTLRIEKILLCKGLTLWQRLSYLTLGLIYLEGWQQLMLFVVPVLTLVFGLAPFKITIFNVLVVLAFPLFTWLLLQELGCGFSRFWTNEIYAMARWPIHVIATLALFGRKLAWKTSAKNIKGRVSWRLMMPQLTVLVTSLTAVTIAAWRLTQQFQVGPLGQAVLVLSGPTRNLAQIDLYAEMPSGYSIDLVAIASFWALFNAARAVWFLVKAIHNARQSHACFRFTVSFPAALTDYAGTWARTEQIAEDWVRIRLPASFVDLVKQERLRLRLVLPNQVLEVGIAIQRRGRDWIEGEFIWDTELNRDRLSACLYSVNWHREYQVNHAYFLTPSDVLLALIGLRRPCQPKASEWQPVLLETKDLPSKYALGFTVNPGPGDGETPLISFSALGTQANYMAWAIGDEGRKRLSLKIVAEQPISALPNCGLDGTVYRRYTTICREVPESLAGLEKHGEAESRYGLAFD